MRGAQAEAPAHTRAIALLNGHWLAWLASLSGSLRSDSCYYGISPLVALISRPNSWVRSYQPSRRSGKQYSSARFGDLRASM